MDQRTPNRMNIFTRATRPMRAAAKATIFFLKVFPMLPSRPVDWVTKPPMVEKVRYPTRSGQAEGDLYRPAGARSVPRHRGVPGGRSIRRRSSPGAGAGESTGAGRVRGAAVLVACDAGFPARSRGRREYRFGLPLADLSSPRLTLASSGLIGTCVGGAFALMAAAHPLIRERVAFILRLCAFFLDVDIRAGYRQRHALRRRCGASRGRSTR